MGTEHTKIFTGLGKNSYRKWKFLYHVPFFSHIFTQFLLPISFSTSCDGHLLNIPPNPLRLLFYGRNILPLQSRNNSPPQSYQLWWTLLPYENCLRRSSYPILPQSSFWRCRQWCNGSRSDWLVSPKAPQSQIYRVQVQVSKSLTYDYSPSKVDINYFP